MSFAMTSEEREAFLSEAHVAIVAIAREGLGPLAVPVWYAYEPAGEIRFTTGRRTQKAELLQEKERFSLCVQTEQPPYKYVSVEGYVESIEQADLERDLRPIARRYLGRAEGDAYAEELRADYEGGESILIRMRPERWYSADYGKEG